MVPVRCDEVILSKLPIKSTFRRLFVLEDTHFNFPFLPVTSRFLCPSYVHKKYQFMLPSREIQFMSHPKVVRYHCSVPAFRPSPRDGGEPSVVVRCLRSDSTMNYFSPDLSTSTLSHYTHFFLFSCEAVPLLTHFLCQIPNDLSSLTSALLKEYTHQLYATVD